jgi:hypothetical protein
VVAGILGGSGDPQQIVMLGALLGLGEDYEVHGCVNLLGVGLSAVPRTFWLLICFA